MAMFILMILIEHDFGRGDCGENQFRVCDVKAFELRINCVYIRQSQVSASASKILTEIERMEELLIPSKLLL